MKKYMVTLGDVTVDIWVDSAGTITSPATGRTFRCSHVDPHSVSIVQDGQPLLVSFHGKNGEFTAVSDGHAFTVAVQTEREALLRKYARAASTQKQHVQIRAPMPAMVVKVLVGPGQEITVGQSLVVLEAMKMENEIKSHSAGRIKEVYVVAGKPIEKGELLLEFE